MNSFQNYGSYHPVNNTNENATHEYIDCEIINNSTTNLDPIPVVFNQVKTSQLVDNCSDYYLSVVRWSLDSGLPQIIPQIKLGNGTAINDTEYIVNIGWDNAVNPTTDASRANIVFYPEDAPTVTTRLIFEPEDITLTPPAKQPLSQDDVYNNQYYYMHSIGNFLEMLNKAIATAFATFTAKNAITSTAVGGKIPLAAPHFDWNGSVITANVPDSWVYDKNRPVRPTSPLATVQYSNFFLSFNTPLHNLFDTFPYRYINNSVASFEKGQNYVMLFHTNQWDDTYSAGSPLTNYYTYNQEGSSVPGWSPVNSILFQTTTIPINPSKTGAPTYLGESLQTTLQQSGISNVLTDFQIPLDRGDEYTNAILYYTPSSEYRLFDLNSNGGLLNINIRIFWKDKLGFIHPFLLKNGAGGSLKMLLRKKNFNGL
jgi:hypothetical protein